MAMQPLLPSVPLAPVAAPKHSAPCAAVPADEYVPGELMMKSSGGLGADEAAHLQALGVKSMRRFDTPRSMQASLGGDMYHVKLADGVSVEEAMRLLRAERSVAWAEPNWRVHTFDRVPNDLDPKLWGLRNSEKPGADVHATEAWQTTVGKTQAEGGPLVAIIDTGMDYTHPDLAANVHLNAGEVAGDGVDNDGNGFVDDVHGCDFANRDGDPMDGRGHGTHVAGTIAAEGDNGIGGVGVSWKANLMPLKFLDDNGFGDLANAVDALLYAEKMGARITSNSWGGGSYSQALYETMKASHALHICAAGNDGNDSDSRPAYPAGYELDNIIAVAATDRNDEKASFSNYGARSVDIAAPGHEIWSTLPGGQYGTKSGTSMAAPQVTGAAALVLSQFPDLSNAQLKERLIDSVDPVPSLAAVSVSGGRLNVARALIADDVPPAPVGDLRALSAAPDGLTVGWTASGDDGAQGTAARYEMRWSDRPIVEHIAGEGQVSWDEAQAVSALPVPSAAGAPQQAAVPLLPSAAEHDVWVALKVHDKVGNAPPVSVARMTVPSAKVAFRDDFESGLGQWSADGTWAITTENGNHVVSDSPIGDYPPYADTSLTSRPIDLAGFAHPVMKWKNRYTVENNFDRLGVEVSTDGRSWTEAERLVGSVGWQSRSCDLSAYAGQMVQVRFHLKTDGDIEMDGIHLDDVVIVEG